MNTMKSKSVLVHGRAVNCVETGSGPVLLLVHGMAGTIGNWQEVACPVPVRHQRGLRGRGCARMRQCAWPGQCSGANRAVKCRSCRGWDTMRMPGSWAARLATRVTASIT